eukprot:CAMPEP_0203712590 /NCGR_PEP_ID=MMETSP0091-20130426/70115_1 /ASSEMBLY_ACC=CAM_ASM_001089 /TAXON_ID=426623 /ORGANISM="Chaetoceros affinis, Strain CCMP159" /LENGTH=275 /DNA_ID=CAMNT_0050590571 /DNA_START=626 /DNA_END=1453 /DNA_ORIENTATION=-
MERYVMMIIQLVLLRHHPETNWNYILGCYSGTIDDTEVVNSDNFQMPADCVIASSTPAPVTPTLAPVTSTPAPVTSTHAPVASTPAPVASTPSPVDCSAKLVAVQTGPSTTCDGGNEHWWPLEGGCHGWEGLSPNGEIHLNSASGMKCIDEDTFTFDQYAGSLDCTGTAVTKTIHFDTCEQDRPPVLYSKGINFECCKNPDSESCKTAAPYVTLDGTTVIYKDGEICDDDNTTGTTSSPTSSPMPPSGSSRIGRYPLQYGILLHVLLLGTFYLIY